MQERDFAESGIGHLWLLAVGLAFCAVLRRRRAFVYASAASGLMGYAPYALFDLTGTNWSFSPWWVVLTTALVGGAALYTAQTAREGNALPAAQIGAVALLIANGHALSQLLPSSLHYAWALLSTALAWPSRLVEFRAIEGNRLRISAGDSGRFRLRFDSLERLLFLDRPPPDSLLTRPPPCMPSFCSSSHGGIIAGIGSGRRSAWRAREFWGRGAATRTFRFLISQFGLTLTIIGGVWYGASRILRQRPEFAKILEDAALILTTAGSAIGLIRRRGEPRFGNVRPYRAAGQRRRQSGARL